MSQTISQGLPHEQTMACDIDNDMAKNHDEICHHTFSHCPFQLGQVLVLRITISSSFQRNMQIFIHSLIITERTINTFILLIDTSKKKRISLIRL
jgi:hypothetical protein